VVTTNTTVFGNGLTTLPDVHVGDRVGVTGQKQADGSVLASSVVRLP